VDKSQPNIDGTAHDGVLTRDPKSDMDIGTDSRCANSWGPVVDLTDNTVFGGYASSPHSPESQTRPSRLTRERSPSGYSAGSHGTPSSPSWVPWEAMSSYDVLSRFTGCIVNPMTYDITSTIMKTASGEDPSITRRIESTDTMDAGGSRDRSGSVREESGQRSFKSPPRALHKDDDAEVKAGLSSGSRCRSGSSSSCSSSSSAKPVGDDPPVFPTIEGLVEGSMDALLSAGSLDLGLFSMLRSTLPIDYMVTTSEKRRAEFQE
jgi:hypothetical protein